MAVLWALFRFTKLGLALRASAVDPAASRLLGVRVTWMLVDRLGPRSGPVGAVAGMLAAPALFIFTPGFMQVIIIYAFAAAVLGGIESPVGAVIGGLTLGVDDQPARRRTSPDRSRPTCACRSRSRSCSSCSSSGPSGLSGDDREARVSRRRFLAGPRRRRSLVAGGRSSLLPLFLSDTHEYRFAFVGDLLHRRRSGCRSSRATRG